MHARVGRFSTNAPSPQISILRHLRHQTAHFHIRLQTLLPCFLSPTSFHLSLHFKFPTCRHPIFRIHTFNVSKPTQSTFTNHPHHTLNTKALIQRLTPAPVR